jgi:hypothetical protein
MKKARTTVSADRRAIQRSVRLITEGEQGGAGIKHMRLAAARKIGVDNCWCLPIRIDGAEGWRMLFAFARSLAFISQAVSRIDIVGRGTLYAGPPSGTLEVGVP